MALRQIRTLGDDVLEKHCREVKEMTPRLLQLVDDMIETMYDQEGVGLAAPQVGVLRRIAVIDTGEGPEADESGTGEENTADAETDTGETADDAAKTAGAEKTYDAPEWSGGPIVLVNPKVVETDGEQKGSEGCLSVPGKAGAVTRPQYVKVEALDRDMNPIVVEGQGLLARALCHEIDHLDGVMYVTKVEGELYDVNDEE